jgi:hypothetical protein
MNRCIVTKYAGPTNHRGARIIASAYGKRVVVPWDHSVDVTDNHDLAATYAASKLDWKRLGPWTRHSATAPDGHSRVHMFVMEEIDV